MNQVYVGGSYFHIYVSILKSINREDKSTKSLFVLNDHTPGIESLIPALKKSGYFDEVIQIPFVALKQRMKREQSRFARLLSRNKYVFEYVEQNSSILQYECFIRNSEINMFYKLGLCPFYFILKFGKTTFIRLVEDGENNYRPRTGRFKAFRRRFLAQTAIGEGFDPEVKEIEVQQPHRLNNRVRHKGKTLELKRMQNNLSKEDKNNILNIFLNEQPINVHAGKNLLLITQPWSEDKHMSEAGKVELYNRILELHGAGHSIFLKAHPRDLTDYKGKLKFEFTEIPRAFPLEMLDFLDDIHFQTGLTVTSSALHNVRCVEEKVFTGNDYLEAYKNELLNNR